MKEGRKQGMKGVRFIEAKIKSIQEHEEEQKKGHDIVRALHKGVPQRRRKKHTESKKRVRGREIDREVSPFKGACSPKKIHREQTRREPTKGL